MKHLPSVADTVCLLCLATVLHAQQPTLEVWPPQTPPLQKQAFRRIRISEALSDKMIVSREQPEYPSEARRMHVEGSVVMRVLISDTGDVTQLLIMSGDKLLVQSAVTAVKKWKYRPYMLDGEATEVETQVTVRYELP